MPCNQHWDCRACRTEIEAAADKVAALASRLAAAERERDDAVALLREAVGHLEDVSRFYGTGLAKDFFARVTALLAAEAEADAKGGGAKRWPITGGHIDTDVPPGRTDR